MSKTKSKIEGLISKYGPFALATYLSIFLLTWSGFAAALALGVELDSAAGGVGIAGASWLATKVTQPLRIGATAVLTPVVAGIWQRFRGPEAQAEAVDDEVIAQEREAVLDRSMAATIDDGPQKPATSPRPS